MDSLPRKHLRESLTTAVLLSLSLLVMAGCGLTVNNPASSHPTGTTAASDSGPSIEGHVGGEQWGVSNATIQLYSLGTKGIASAASPLLTQPVLTDTSGNFKITEAYSCPSSTAQLYLVASGGNPGLGGATDNQAIALMTMLGPCNGSLLRLVIQ